MSKKDKILSELSYQLSSKLSLDEKKKDGIYFTPNNIVKKNLIIIKNYCNINNITINSVLEPACGSCEYINKIHILFNNHNFNVLGIEYNKIIFKEIEKLKLNKNIKLINQNFLDYNNDEKYDLIIGNPPFYVINKTDIESFKNKVNETDSKAFENKYNKYYTGRANIFILFIIHSLNLLNNNGILSFVLPKSFVNCMYYDKLRNHIYHNYKIIDLFESDSQQFIATGQKVIVLIIHKVTSNTQELLTHNNNFTLIKNNYTIFNTQENIKRIKDLYIDSTTLNQLKFDVKVGSVVWNQVKGDLTDDTTKTRLIYNGDIVDNVLTLKEYKGSKKNFINKKGKTEPLLIINRGYGRGDYNFNYCLLDLDFPYLIENHIICIESEKKMSKENLISYYKNIISSISNSKTKKFIDLYFGNNAINTTELKYILPIYTITNG